MFTYQPLDPDNRELRLVRLRQKDPQSRQDKIELDLKHVSMSHDISYAAVSYVWGDATDTVDIIISGESFRIGRNLHAALAQFRQNGVDSWLWIDAICIHQADDEEKSRLVDRMRDVFREAALVYVWLGPGTTATDKAMDLIARIGPRAVQCGAMDLRSTRQHDTLPMWYNTKLHEYLGARSRSEHDECASVAELGNLIHDLLHEDGLMEAPDKRRAPDSLTAGLQDILRRDYWHRVWIVQEITLARQGLIFCGEKSVTLDEFDATLTAIFYCVQTEPYELFPKWKSNSLRGFLHGALFPSKAMLIRERYRRQGATCTIRLSDILLETFSAPRRYHYTASDPRDLVFGLLGVVSAEQKLGMHADYHKTAAEVLALFTKALLRASMTEDPERPGVHQRFNLNCSFPKKDLSGNFPTWVPDWVAIGKYGIEPFPLGLARFDAAAAGTLLQPDNLDENPEDVLLLRCSGCRVDVITEVMTPAEWTVTEWPADSRIRNENEWLASIFKFVGLGTESGPGEEYVWRTITAMDPGRRFGPLWWNNEQQSALVRKIMRGVHIDAANLTEDEAEFYWLGPYSDYLEKVDKLEDRVEIVARDWKKRLPCRSRTFFKTVKGMFGLGHESVRAGDVVVLLWGVPTPMVLRPSDGSGFALQGDAYVDGIMHGEFLETEPAHEVFEIF
ncbi:heterokaryon incompatibility protein-domain-containing protein [Apodospora peruviana]|uniref:Heterokaryon incompatibility protein-domain-containing protein n=1 Tax=Apodospora peruviana TaxID=516989 RepID=A0AAE0M796_9PEZI|nr:heterokaryon incompatibility protein-domain-containing protein [Apodospora peruviana]